MGGGVLGVGLALHPLRGGGQLAGSLSPRGAGAGGEARGGWPREGGRRGRAMRPSLIEQFVSDLQQATT